MAKTEARLRIALLVQTASSWSREVLAGVGRYAQENGGWEFWGEPRGFQELLVVPKNWRADGVICRLSDPRVADSIRERRLPAVNVSWLGGQFEEIPQVISDDALCAGLGARFLMSKGFRHLGYVGPQPSLGYGAHVANAFSRPVHERAGAGTDVREFEYTADADISELREDLEEWVESLPKPAAVFVWSTYVGRQVIASCLNRGMSVPDDVAILALEHEPLVSALSPVPISSIDQHPHQVGYMAAKLLHRMIVGKDAGKDFQHRIPPVGVQERLSTDTQFSDDPIVRKAIQVMHELLNENVHVNDVASAVDVSRRALEYRFRRALRRSPSDEIRRLRLARIRRFLVDSDLSITEIATACGYAHQETMIRFFKREVGLSPGEFRRQMASSCGI